MLSTFEFITSMNPMSYMDDVQFAASAFPPSLSLFLCVQLFNAIYEHLNSSSMTVQQIKVQWNWIVLFPDVILMHLVTQKVAQFLFYICKDNPCLKLFSFAIYMLYNDSKKCV